MKKVSLYFFVLVYLLSSTFAFAASWATTASSAPSTPSASSNSKVDHFELSTNPSTAKVWEAIDLTVKAVDKDLNVKKDYAWTIYITVDTDTKATVPYSDWYQFVSSDLWQKTFSKWLSFTKTWKMKVVVMDIDNDQLEWTIDIDVWNWSWDNSWTSKWDIIVTSPDNWVSISWNSINVTWTSKKNSKIKFFLNWQELTDLETQTDEKWAFSVELKDITQAQNVLTIKVFDWQDKVIAESDKITFSMDSTWPSVKSFKVVEWSNAPAWSEVNVILVSDPWLADVTATIADSVQVLKEDSTTLWTYKGKLTLPTTPWEYPIDLTLKNSLWKTTNKTSAATITADQSNIFKNIKTVLWDKRVTFTFDVSPDKADYAKFKFYYGTSQETLQTAWDTQVKFSTTFDKDKIKSSSGSYSWYVPWLDTTVWKYYFKIVPVWADSKDIAWIESDIVEADFSLYSAGWKCMIANVSWLKSEKKWDVVELSWDSLPEATSYNVYKKWTDWNFALLENVSTNKYIINLVWDKVKYDEFTIKAVCWDWEAKAESSDYSNASKVQTWPTQIALIAGLSLIIWFLFVRRRYSK